MVRKNRRLPGDRSVLIVAFLVCAMVLGGLLLQKYETSKRSPVVPPQPHPQGTMLVTLFFAAPDGNGLVREGREIDACGEQADCVSAVVRELINGPVGNNVPSLPAAMSVLGARVEGDMAVVDLDDGLANGLPGGSDSEVTAVYSIVDTVATNFPTIKKVKLLQNGVGVDTLKGHLDLREPLTPDFSLEKK